MTSGWIESFEAFTDDLRQARPNEVAIRPEQHWPTGLDHRALGGVYDDDTLTEASHHSYGLLYIVSRGSEVTNHVETLFTARNIGANAHEDIIIARSLQTILAASVQLKLIRSQVRDTKLYVADEQGEPMTDAALDNYQARATAMRLVSPR